MRLSARFALLALLSCPLLALAAPPAAAISSTLALGSQGPDVVLLQQLLNSASDTRVALMGPGSPGMETAYFGPKTLDAVKRFQNKYRADILVPNGLLAPTGVVGPATRAQLQKLISPAPAVAQSQSAATTPRVQPPTTTAELPPVVVSMQSSTALAKILGTSSPSDLYLRAVDRRLVKNGVSSSTEALIEAKIRSTTASSANLQQQFFDEQRKFYKKASDAGDSPAVAFVKSALSSVAWFFAPQTAHAAVTALSMGGYIVYVNPFVCDCPPGITQIFVALPLASPLTSNLLLNYIDGSQAFSWYNIPEPGIEVLGLYEPFVLGSCWTFIPATPPFCVPIPSDGLITPIVGSSLI